MAEQLKIVERKSSTGGNIVEFFNEQGQRVRLVHTAGSAYSGKIATQEEKVKVDKQGFWG